MVCALTASGLPPGGQRGGEEESADVRIGVYDGIHRSAGTRAVGRWSLALACVLCAGFAGGFFCGSLRTFHSKTTNVHVISAFGTGAITFLFSSFYRTIKKNPTIYLVLMVNFSFT